MFLTASIKMQPRTISGSQLGVQEWLIYRAIFERIAPSIVLRLFTSKMYLLRLEYSSAFVRGRPTYSLMRSPFLKERVAKRPSPALDLPTPSPAGDVVLFLPLYILHIPHSRLFVKIMYDLRGPTSTA